MIEACEELGCFRIINHHKFLPPALSSEMKAVARSLMELSAEIKRRNEDVIRSSGYEEPTQFNPHFEALGLYDMASAQAVDAFCTQLDASPHQSLLELIDSEGCIIVVNINPQAGGSPRPIYKETIKMYAQAVHNLTMDIACKIVEGMGLVRVSFEGWPCQLKINKYNFTPETIDSCGVRIHSDVGFLTILQDDESVGGLEIMDKSGAFVAVEPLPGSLLVNLGDIATVWSNGRLCNVKHRVVCKEARTRISIASFMLGPKEETVETPMELVDSSHPRLFVPFTYQYYRNLRSSIKLVAGEVLDLLRTDS